MLLLTVALTGPVLVIVRSADFLLNEAATTEIYALSLHDALPITEAVFVMVPAVAGAVTVMVNVELAPAGRLPKEQDTVPAEVVLPVLAETKLTPAGGVSVTVTPGAGPGTLLGAGEGVAEVLLAVALEG